MLQKMFLNWFEFEWVREVWSRISVTIYMDDIDFVIIEGL